MSKKLAIRLFAVLSALLPLLGQAAPASAASGGTLFAVYAEAQVVKLDPVTGNHTTIADFTVPTPPGVALGDLVSDAAGHRLFAQLTTFSFDPAVPTTYQLVTVSTQGGVSSVAPTLEDQMTLAWDPAGGTLFGLTNGSSIVKVDPTTGAETSVATLPAGSFSNMAIAAHTIYLSQQTPGVFPPTSQLLSVDTTTGAVASGPALNPGVRTLAYDSSAGSLFGRTFCCPVRIVTVDPGTGSVSPVGAFDLGFGGNSLTVDPNSRTLYSMEDTLGIFGFTQNVATINESGTLSLSADIPLVGYIRSLAFEAPAITPDSIIADVKSAQAGGAISNAGVATSLLAKLDEAKAARARGQCGVAADLYRAFINEVGAQSGRTIGAATAAQLSSEAQFLIANCP